MPGRLLWERDGAGWPNACHSRFVTAAGFQWHVQVAGNGPVLLLLHGTGAATHSWRTLLPLLAADFTVVAPDLPGHGFTQTPAGALMSLPGMARGVAALLKVLGLTPDLVVGHSAGAAILARMCLDRQIAPRALVSLNGAMLPLPNMPTELFAPLARGMAAWGLVSRIAARQAATPRALDRLIRSTGSTLDAEGTELYRRVVGNPGHVAGALAMMANWSLRDLAHDLPLLRTPLVLVVGQGDLTIPPSDAARVRRLLPTARVISLPGLGHLAHEEAPGRTASITLEIWQSMRLDHEAFGLLNPDVET
jgi:magnesium chelatase accessory protein